MSDKAKELAEWLRNQARSEREYDPEVSGLVRAGKLDAIAAELTRLAEVESLLRKVHDDLMLRAQIRANLSASSDVVVPVSATTWDQVCAALGAKDKGE